MEFHGMKFEAIVVCGAWLKFVVTSLQENLWHINFDGIDGVTESNW